MSTSTSKVQELKLEIRKKQLRIKKTEKKIKNMFQNINCLLHLDKVIVPTIMEISLLGVRFTSSKQASKITSFRQLSQAKARQLLNDMDLRDYLVELRQKNVQNSQMIGGFVKRAEQSNFQQRTAPEYQKQLLQQFCKRQKSALQLQIKQTLQRSPRSQQKCKKSHKTISNTDAHQVDKPKKLCKSLTKEKNGQNKEKDQFQAHFQKSKKNIPSSESRNGIYFDLKKTLQIANGYNKSADIFRSNKIMAQDQLPVILKRYKINAMSENPQSTDKDIDILYSNKHKHIFQRRNGLEYNYSSINKNKATLQQDQYDPIMVNKSSQNYSKHNYHNPNLKMVTENRQKYDIKKFNIGNFPEKKKQKFNPAEQSSLDYIKTGKAQKLNYSAEQKYIKKSNQNRYNFIQQSTPNSNNVQQLNKVKFIEDLRDQFNFQFREGEIGSLRQMEENQSGQGQHTNLEQLKKRYNQVLLPKRMSPKKLTKKNNISDFFQVQNSSVKMKKQAKNCKKMKLKKQLILRKRVLTFQEMSLINQKSQSPAKDYTTKFGLPEIQFTSPLRSQLPNIKFDH